MKEIKTKFNVSKIIIYGNGGGSEITLRPAANCEDNKKIFGSDLRRHLTGKIKLRIPSESIADFESGVYTVTFTKDE